MKNKIKELIMNPLVIALLSYSAILYQIDAYHDFNSYKILYLIAFVGIYILFKRFDNKTLDKRGKKYALGTSVVLAIILILGRTVKKYLGSATNFINFKNVFLGFGFTIFLIPFIYVLICYLIKFVMNYKLDKKEVINSKKLALYSFILIVLGKIPYLLTFFPGVMTIDSLDIINWYEKGLLINHHPLAFTYFFGTIYKIGKTLFNSGTMGICFYIIVQIIIIAVILTSVITYLNKKGVPKIITYILVLYFSFAPDFGYMSVTLWKDVLFGVAFIPFSLAILNIVDKDKVTRGNYIVFLLSSMMILFFRNNGIYVYILALLVFLLVYFKKHKIIPISALVLVSAFYIITGPIYKMIGVTYSRTAESYSILLQQVGRVYVNKGYVDKESDEYFKKLINTDNLEEEYKTWIADPVKDLTDSTILKETQKDFFKYWFKTFLNNPTTYVEAYLTSTLGYWYPDSAYVSVRESSDTTLEVYDVTQYGIYKKSLAPSIVRRAIMSSTSKNLPLVMMVWSLGFSFVLLILSFMLSLYTKVDKRIFAIYLPLFGLWFTNMIAAPVYNEYRYMYGLVVCNVILVAIPFIYKKVIK